MALMQKQLTVWNNNKTKLGGVSANENWNVSIGLPNPETRKVLNKVHDANFGCCFPGAKVTMKMYKDYLEIHHV
jgi:hypothetical protein